jgi:hypothetical protein
LVAGAVGLIANPYTAAAAAIYFGVDAFYPRGWSGSGSDVANFWQDVSYKTMQGIREYNRGFSRW